MGLYLSLNLTPSIASDEWDRFWGDSLQLLQDFPVRLVRPADRKTARGVQKIWSDHLVETDKKGEYWEIAGDAESLLFGEPVRLYRNLEYYQKKWKPPTQEECEKKTDPLFCTKNDFAQKKGNVPLGGLQFFNTKTQGYPYHYALMAVALLAEHRFPWHSFTWGELHLPGGEAVARWLSSRYNEKIPVPICLDSARLWNRIEGTCGDIATTMSRFEERFIGPPARQIHRMLAESREATMQKLAEQLLQFDTVTIGVKDVAKSFLEATDDLDQFLDLIEHRNSLARDRESNNKKCMIFSLEAILKMLVQNFVLYSQWQGEELQTLRRWLDLEGNITQIFNATFMKASVPDFFKFYCSENDLLETFVQREPSKRELFDRVIQETSAENAESLEMITGAVHMIQERTAKTAEDYEKAKGYAPVDDENQKSFVRYMEEDAFIQSNLAEPLTEKNVAILGRYFGFYVKKMRDITATLEKGAYLNDPTGKKPREVFLTIAQEQNVRLLEDAVLALERTDDVELLYMFAAFCPCLFNEAFRMRAPILFGEGFKVGYPMLMHVINKPIWWKTFREHRNDGFAEGEKST